jgi:putative acetyltransferase
MATLDVFNRAITVTASRDYTAEQISAWTASHVTVHEWSAQRMSAHTWVAEIGTTVVGFTDVDETGYIDMLFVDPDHGRRSIATALLAHVLEVAQANRTEELTVNASVTARPLFERHGFTVTTEQRVERQGVTLINYRMRRVLQVAESAPHSPALLTQTAVTRLQSPNRPTWSP